MNSNIKNIDTDELLEIFTNKTAPILDVRTPLEYARMHIPYSINIPLDILFKKYLLYINRNYEYYVICKDSSRSLRAVEFLINHGYTAVNVTGGMEEWKGPIETDRGF